MLRFPSRIKGCCWRSTDVVSLSDEENAFPLSHIFTSEMFLPADSSPDEEELHPSVCPSLSAPGDVSLSRNFTESSLLQFHSALNESLSRGNEIWHWRQQQRALPQLEVWENVIPWETCWKWLADPTGMLVGKGFYFLIHFTVTGDLFVCILM